MASLIILDKLGRELERHTIDTPLTTWMAEHVPAYEQRVCPPYSARLNGAPWAYVDHGETLGDDDVIVLTIEPGELSTVFAIISLVAAGYSYYVASNIPNTYQESTPAGTSIYSPSGKGNSVSPNAVIREVAGDMPIYPDLICPVRRKFDANIEYLYLNLSVGVGEYALAISNLYIVDTPFANYPGDVSAQISPPGADISAHPAYENWYTTPEISELKLVTVADEAVGAWTIDASGDQMTSYDNGSLVAFPFAVGEYFTLTNSTNAGTYRVSAISGTLSETATVVEQVETTYWDGDGDDPRYSQGGYVTEYEDAETTTLTTTTGEAVNWEALSGGVNWFGPVEIIPPGETTDTIEVDFRFPRGLGKTESDGSISDRTVQVAIEYREVGTTDWTAHTYSYTDNTLDELGFTERVTLTSVMRPEVRVRRVSTEALTTTVIDEVKCARLRGLLQSPTSYAEVTTIQLRIKGTNALAQTAENKINVRGAVRKLPTLTDLKAYVQNGTPYTVTANHGGSNLWPYLAWLIYDASGEDVINWEAFIAQDTYVKSRGESLNIEFADETTVWEAIKVAAAAGLSEMTVKEGLLTPVRIGQTNDIQFFYPPDVMLGSGPRRTDVHYQASEPSGIIVEYLNPTTGNTDTVECFLSGDSRARAKRIQALGITSKTQAWRYGMRERRRLAYKPASITFTTELDAMNSDYGNCDAIAMPINANQSFYVTGVSGSTLSLDGEADLSGPGTYYAVLRQPTGRYSGLYEIAAGSTASDVVLVSPTTLDFTPVLDGSMESTVCVIGTEDELIQKVWIRNIAPSGDESVTVTCEEYVADIFDDDDNSPS